jgi:hypothetical protein
MACQLLHSPCHQHILLHQHLPWWQEHCQAMKEWGSARGWSACGTAEHCHCHLQWGTQQQPSSTVLTTHTCLQYMPASPVQAMNFICASCGLLWQSCCIVPWHSYMHKVAAHKLHSGDNDSGTSSIYSSAYDSPASSRLAALSSREPSQCSSTAATKPLSCRNSDGQSYQPSAVSSTAGSTPSTSALSSAC